MAFIAAVSAALGYGFGDVALAPAGDDCKNSPVAEMTKSSREQFETPPGVRIHPPGISGAVWNPSRNLGSSSKSPTDPGAV